MKIAKVGIIGAGQMGCGIAQVCAMAGYDVGLHDMSAERLSAAITSIDASLARRVKSGKITDEARKAALAHISP
jgi:3-hydroxybutyryl-CoA dehydrogenase